MVPKDTNHEGRDLVSGPIFPHHNKNSVQRGRNKYQELKNYTNSRLNV